MHTPKPLGPGWKSLATAIQVLLGIYLVIAVASLGLLVYIRVQAHEWLNDPEAAIGKSIDGVTASLIIPVAELLLLTVIGVLWVVWQHQAHRSDRLRPTPDLPRPWWSIGCWFIPFVNLVMPAVCVQRIRKAAGPGTALPPSAAKVTAWWLTYLAASAATRIDGAIASDTPVPSTPYVEDLAHYWLKVTLSTIVAEALFAVAAVLAILVVRDVTARVWASEPQWSPTGSQGFGTYGPGPSSPYGYPAPYAPSPYAPSPYGQPSPYGPASPYGAPPPPARPPAASE